MKGKKEFDSGGICVKAPTESPVGTYAYTVVKRYASDGQWLEELRRRRTVRLGFCCRPSWWILRRSEIGNPLGRFDFEIEGIAVRHGFLDERVSQAEYILQQAPQLKGTARK